MLSSTLISATNLLVKEYGVNNTYPTIQAAIDAASHGDSIIVYDKPSGMHWQENIVVDKVVHIVNADGLRQNLDGDIKVEPIPGDVHTFIGVDLLSGHKFYTEYSIDSLTERCTINIIDCSADQVDMNDDGLFVRMISNSIKDIYFKHGLMIDNVGEFFYVTAESYNLNDSLLIIGNRNYQGEINTNASLRIFNNLFADRVAGTQQSGCGGYNNYHPQNINENTTALTITHANSMFTRKNFIANNTFTLHTEHWSGGCYYGDWNQIHYGTGLEIEYYSNYSIYNNVFYNQNQSLIVKSIESIGSSSGTPFVSHNYLDSNCNSIAIPLNNEYQHESDISIDSYGKCSGDCVDGGIYLGQYNDIDGTRNDAGTYGGSYSIDNYLQESEGKARVYHIDMTNFISSPNNISIKGGGSTIH